MTQSSFSAASDMGVSILAKPAGPGGKQATLKHPPLEVLDKWSDETLVEYLAKQGVHFVRAIQSLGRLPQTILVINITQAHAIICYWEAVSLYILGMRSCLPSL